MSTIFFRYGDDNRSAGAVAGYDSTQDLLEHLDSSPLRTLLEDEQAG